VVAAVSRRSLLVFVGVAAALLAAAGVAGAVFIGNGRPDPPPQLRSLDLATCRGLDGEDARGCFAHRFLSVLDGREDPRPGVQAISDLAWGEGGFLLTNCHVIMHTVGRRYASDAGVTLANLMEHLPLSNDPGCSAGFAHGLVTGVAPDLDPSHPAESASVCADADTRWQRYSCVHGFGHAFGRLYGDQLRPTLELCTELGADAAPDCAQGAYHDYWLAVKGVDDTTLRGRPVTDPRRLCGAQPEAFVRPCWYRAFLETRPDGFQIETARDIEDLCEDLEGVQREGCVAGAAVIGPPDPAAQLAICADMGAAADAASCVRATKVQNLLKEPAGAFERLIEGCAAFAPAARGPCYRWLGKVLTIVTDGRFPRTGCARLDAEAKLECEAGARTIDEPLETFS
jgi:hypothetical protein